MKTASILLLGLSGLFLFVAISILITGKDIPTGPDEAFNAGYIVGLFLPTVVCLILGLHLRNKAKAAVDSQRHTDADDEYDQYDQYDEYDDEDFD